jgi:hypothetical protein
MLILNRAFSTMFRSMIDALACVTGKRFSQGGISAINKIAVCYAELGIFPKRID